MANYLENTDPRKVTTKRLLEMKIKKEKIAMLTAYDFSFAKLLDQAGIDIILVGDSASNVMAGNETTLTITLEQMIYHAQSVKRAVSRALVIVDMPFGTVSGDPLKSLDAAIRMMKETRADALKIEGGIEVAEDIKKIINAGIPVMGHLGLMPQSINKYGTYGVRGVDENEASKLIEDAKMLEKIGCFGIVLEKIPTALARLVTSEVSIPIVGIGAGPHVDGQVLVMQDMLGINQDFAPKFLRKYADINLHVTQAVHNYIQDVKEIDFPSLDESY